MYITGHGISPVRSHRLPVPFHFQDHSRHIWDDGCYEGFASWAVCLDISCIDSELPPSACAHMSCCQTKFATWASAGLSGPNCLAMAGRLYALMRGMMLLHSMCQLSLTMLTTLLC